MAEDPFGDWRADADLSGESDGYSGRGDRRGGAGDAGFGQEEGGCIEEICSEGLS